MTWMITEVNGDTVAPEHKDQFGQQQFAPEMYAEDLETVKVIHATAGDFSCKHCGEWWNETDAVEDVVKEECPDRLCEDAECECGMDTDHGPHEVEPAPMSWFEEATVRVDQSQGEVSVELVVNGKRFQTSVWYAENVDGGSLVIRTPGTSGTREVNGITVIAD